MWVTRDKIGTLCLWVHSYPKRKNNGNWFVKEDDYEYWGIPIDKKLFPELTYNDNPLEVTLIQKKPVEQHNYGSTDLSSIEGD